MSAATLPPPARATIDDLMKYDGKAELIKGRIVAQMAAGNRHSQDALEIAISLRAHSKLTGRGTGYGDNACFRVSELYSGRESFSPDAAYVDRIIPRKDPRPIDGPPAFAAEVRSPDDYGPSAEEEMTAKRDDYFEAGTLAVWDVDSRAETVTLFVKNQPPQIFHRGDFAHAEPAVPGWTMKVDDIFG